MRGEAADDEPRAARRGRRRAADAGDTRGEIISAARDEFAANGYDSTSLRAIARRAGVDAALVHHYFADKADLFAATIAVPIRPDMLVAEILRGPRDAIGVTLVRTMLTRLEERPVRDGMLAIVRTAIGHEFAARMVRQFMVREVLGRVADELQLEDGDLRATLAASQIVGLMVARYGIKLTPLADAPIDVVAARVGAAVQWYLVGDPMTRPAEKPTTDS